MLANNETGVIQPVAEIGEIVKAAGGVLVRRRGAGGRAHSARYFRRLCRFPDPVLAQDRRTRRAPARIVAASDLMMPKPLVTGGGQEKGHRAGTENLAGIAGFGAAARRRARDARRHATQLRAMRDRIEQTILSLAPDAEIFGRGAERLANTAFFAIPGMKAETAQIAFDLAGVALSAGSACSSGKVGPSHVLKAMGHGDNDGALRVSIGHGDQRGRDSSCSRGARRRCWRAAQADRTEGRVKRRHGIRSRGLSARLGRGLPSRRVNSRSRRTIWNLRRPARCHSLKTAGP